MIHDLIVTKVGRARELLVQCRDVSSAKKVADIGKAAKVYAERQKLGRESIEYAHAVVVDATALLGDFLRGMEKRGPQHSKGGGSKGSTRAPLPNAPPILDSVGISKKESAVAQRLSRLKEEEPVRFEEVRTMEALGKRESIASTGTIIRRSTRLLHGGCGSCSYIGLEG